MLFGYRVTLHSVPEGTYNGVIADSSEESARATIKAVYGLSAEVEITDVSDLVDSQYFGMAELTPLD